MGAAREKDQADFDLERFVDMFDEATTSRDPRVIDALRSLMMIVTLTRPESQDSGLHDRNPGPLRRLFEDVDHLNRRLHRMEDELRGMRAQNSAGHGYEYTKYPNEKYLITATQALAQDIDRTVLNQIGAISGTKINKGLK